MQAGEHQLRASRASIHATSLVPACCVDVFAPHLVTVGANCIVSGSARLLVHDAAYYPINRIYRIAPVVIEDNCFIGHNATILPGSVIGRGTIVAAGAVVSGIMPPMCVVGGVPARVLHPLRVPTKGGEYIQPRFHRKFPGDISSSDLVGFCHDLLYECSGD